MFSLQQLQSGLIDRADLGADKRFKLSEDITEFPQELFYLAEDIEILDLGGNQLSDLPDDFYRFKNLRILFLTDNKFEYIPPVLAECNKLEMIAFKSNKLKAVQENCLPLSTRWLILTNNQIESLPHSIGQLVHLRKLALAGNQLTSLPDSMVNCQALELLRLSANQLQVIPDWLFSLPKLSWLAFSGNPVCNSKDNTLTHIPQVKFNALTLNHEIGEGASGVIYHANWVNHKDNDTQDKQPVAVKIFKGAVMSDGYPQDEIQCCLKVGEHPNLIEVLSHIDDNQQLGLVMTLISPEFINLGLPPSLITCTRDTFKQNMKLYALDILKIATQMADILKHMHQQGVSHGDVYAHNTMFDSQNNILFGDFGAATNLDTLSFDNREKVQLIEMRAFGCLLDDLLALVESKDVLFESLVQIKNLAMQDDITQRPSFLNMCDLLHDAKLNSSV